MNRFITLIRKDLADYRGALVWTPAVVAAIVLGLSLVASMMGRFEPGFDFSQLQEAASEDATARSAPAPTPGPNASTEPGKGLVIEGGDGDGVVIDRDTRGEPRIRIMGQELVRDGRLDPDERAALRGMVVAATSVGAVLPVGIAGVVIVFTLLGALYDERKDRSILFWKSMPASDLETVASKVVTIGGIGLACAVASGLVIHLGLNLIAFTRFGGEGMGWIGADTLGWMVQIWAFLGAATVVYLLWALPVYAWIAFASAASPKAPILLGLVPFALVPMAAQVVGLYSEWLLEPVARLVGQPMWELFGDIPDPAGTVRSGAPDLAPLFEALGASLVQPGLWIGLAVAAALIYAAAEVRRRKAL